jgi:hypothetical protein
VVGMATRTDWAKRVEEWKKSGLTAREFGERTGATPKKLYWWSWFLRRQGKTAAGRSVVSRTREPAAFLPVVLRPKVTIAATQVRTGATARVEIGFGNGCVLRTEPVNARWVADLIAVVGGARGC